MQLHQSFKTLLATVVLGFGLAACGGGSQGSDQPASGSSAANASAASGAASDDALAKIKERGVIRIGVFGDKPPFGYVDANGKSQGFDVEIA